MADCIVGGGAVAVDAGGRVLAWTGGGGGGEVPVQDAELGSDPAKDTVCGKLSGART